MEQQDKENNSEPAAPPAGETSSSSPLRGVRRVTKRKNRPSKKQRAAKRAKAALLVQPAVKSLVKVRRGPVTPRSSRQHLPSSSPTPGGVGPNILLKLRPPVVTGPGPLPAIPRVVIGEHLEINQGHLPLVAPVLSVPLPPVGAAPHPGQPDAAPGPGSGGERDPRETSPPPRPDGPGTVDTPTPPPLRRLGVVRETNPDLSEKLNLR